MALQELSQSDVRAEAYRARASVCDIVACGAQGGENGGHGAKIGGDLTLTAGGTLTIVVGGAGGGGSLLDGGLMNADFVQLANIRNGDGLVTINKPSPTTVPKPAGLTLA